MIYNVNNERLPFTGRAPRSYVLELIIFYSDVGGRTMIGCNIKENS